MHVTIPERVTSNHSDSLTSTIIAAKGQPLTAEYKMVERIPTNKDGKYADNQLMEDTYHVSTSNAEGRKNIHMIVTGKNDLTRRITHREAVFGTVIHSIFDAWHYEVLWTCTLSR